MDLQGLDLLQRDGFLVPSELLKELLFITILFIIQQVHQPKELPHVVLHRGTCSNIGQLLIEQTLLCPRNLACVIQHGDNLNSSLQHQNAKLVDPQWYP